MDYIEKIIGYLASQIVFRNEHEIVKFCVNNGIGYGDIDEFVEQFDVEEFDDFNRLLINEIIDATMYYTDAFEILKEYGWLTNWDKLTDYNGGEWYGISQVAEAALWYEFHADEDCMEDLKEAVFLKIENNLE